MELLRNGSRGEEVRELQQKLSDAGFDPGPIDGIFGSKTDVAVRKFQESKGITVDGIVGPMTWSKFNLKPGEKTEGLIAWGSKVSEEFKNRTSVIANTLGTSADFLMASMAFETGETFSPSIENAAGSGAVGLIQFMPSTAKSLGSSSEELKKMSAVQQLAFVEKYFAPFKNRLKGLDDVYMAIFMPTAVGKSNDTVLIDKDTGPTAYRQNKGLDTNSDGKITKGEASIHGA